MPQTNMVNKLETPAGKTRIVLMCLVLLSTLGIFSISLNYDFVYDDELYVYENPIIKSFSAENLYKMAVGEHSPTWHPFTWLSHALDYNLYGLNPAGHRLTNIVLHGISALCVFYLFVMLLDAVSPKRETGATTEYEISILTGAAFAALLFAIHPLRVESVVWVAERKGLLAALFFIATLISYLKFAEVQTVGARKTLYIVTLVLFSLALMSKPTVVMLPLILLLLDAFPLNRFRGRQGAFRILLEKVPFFVLSLIVGILELKGEAEGKTLTSLHIMGVTDRLVHVVRSYAFYIEKTLLPIELVPFYPIPTNTSFFSTSFLVSLAVLSGITAMTVRMWKHGQFSWLTAWLYYLVTSLPIISIIHSGKHLMADRYSYIPTLSFYLLVGAGLTSILRNSHTKYSRGFIRAGVFSVGILIIVGCLTFQQISVWKNPMFFWKYVMNAYPFQAFRAYTNLGNYYMDMGLLDEAEKNYKAVVKLKPDRLYPHINLGALYVTTHRWEEAESELKLAIKLKPEHPIAYHNLGTLYIKEGFLKKGEATLKAAIDIRPDYYQAYYNLGLLYRKQGLIDKAIVAMETAYKINPDYEKALVNLIELFQENAQAKKHAGKVLP